MWTIGSPGNVDLGPGDPDSVRCWVRDSRLIV